MIDRASRNKLAQNLRQYTSGRITNDSLSDLELNRDDAGVHAVAFAAWYLYDDLHTHRATDTFHISRESKHEISRWILFLQTNEEFLWPNPNLSIVTTLLNMVTFGFYSKVIGRKEKDGDNDVWPFFKKEDYEAALANPKYLASRKCETTI